MIQKRRGLTLIEVVLAVALLVVVSLMVFTFLQFGDRIFNRGEDRFDIQSEVRLASDFISDELRYATSISLYSDYHTVVFDNTNYKYLYIDDSGTLMFGKGDGSPCSAHSATVLDPDLLYTIEPYINKTSVNFVISGTIKDETYEVTTSVFLNNIKQALPAATGQVIEYKSPSS